MPKYEELSQEELRQRLIRADALIRRMQRFLKVQIEGQSASTEFRNFDYREFKEASKRMLAESIRSFGEVHESL